MFKRCLLLSPIDILEYTYEAILLHKEIEDICSKNIISDVRVSVQLLKAALNSAYLNVLININSISNEAYVFAVRERSEKLLLDGNSLADQVYEKVLKIMSV